MTILSGAPGAPAYTHAVDLDVVEPRFEILIDELSTPFSVEALTLALSSGIAEAGAVLRAVPIYEGRLIERGIGLIAELNPELVVLTQNLRLPVTKTALELVEKNDPSHYRFLTLDADSGGRKGYTPDLILVNRRKRLAHVVDVKRSLGSYEVSRINELKSRMLAAALVVPDLLYKEHHRLVAEEVQVVILNAENQRSDIAGGVWPLTNLDHLLAVAGAGAAISKLQALFRSRIEENWKQARETFATPKGEAACHHTQLEAADAGGSERGSVTGLFAVTDRPKGGGHIRVGFARIPRASTG